MAKACMRQQQRDRQQERSWPATSLVYGKKMHPTPALQICYTLCPCTHAPQSAHSSPYKLTRVHYSHMRVFTPTPSFSHTWTPTAHCPFTKPSGAHSLQMQAFHILTGRAQPLQLSQAHKSRPLTRAHTSLVPCHVRAHPGGSRVPPMSAPRPGPSGLRQSRRGAATS